jgi:hypothetical protein
VCVLRARALAVLSSMLVLAVPGQALAQSTQTGSMSARTGGAMYGEEPGGIPQVTVPGTRAVLMENGYAAAPEAAPAKVKAAIWGANEIVDKPYRYGGGHATFNDTGYDCSGTVSYALNKGGLLESPLDSSSFMRWGKRGKGRWITVFTNPGHAYVVLAGLRLDTSAAGDSRDTGRGPRWRATGRAMKGFKRRHPLGF